MTIQRTVLFSLTAVLMSSQAHAQCYRSQRILISPPPHISHYSPHISHYAPRTTYRQHLINPHIQTVEVPPDPSAITFGAFSHVDELAFQLEVLMNEICLDLAYNYSHNPDFHATYTEAYSLYQTARYIHASEHNFDRETVKQQLGGADALFHHIQDDLRGWTRHARRQIGALGIIAKMELAEDTLHHLMKDVGVVVTPGLEEPPAPQELTFAPAAPTLP